jgi:microsomal dipeptidase-like Zn-dependent dipeptidase
MLVDLHAHYPMHVMPRLRRDTHAQIKRWRGAWLRAQIVRLLSLFFNYQGPGDEPGVTLELMHRGDVGVIFSALYCPFDEIDLSKRYGARPEGGYFTHLLEQLEDVEADIRSHRQAGVRATIAHSPQELEQALASGEQVLIHSVEGGFHLGGTDEEVRNNVATLAQRGVVCITVAHLFWRKVATNAPALPFMPDWLYRLIFRQPRRQGLTALGKTLVRGMVEHGLLIDVTHMSEAAMNDTFELLDELGGVDRIPVVATHMAFRFGGLAYNLNQATVERIVKRGGVLGLISCEHYISDGERKKPESFNQSFDLVCRQIDEIHKITGSHDHVAFGSDIDGYIKPALPGLEHLGRMHRLQQALADRYGPDDARKLCSGNALQVIGATWQRHF